MPPKTASNLPAPDGTMTPSGKRVGNYQMYFFNVELLNTTNNTFKNHLKNELSKVCNKIQGLTHHIKNEFENWSVLGFLTKCCKSDSKGRGDNASFVLTDEEELVGIACLKKKGNHITLAVPLEKNRYNYKTIDIGIGGKDLYIDLLCGIQGKGYGKIATSYVEKLAKKYGYEKIVLNSIPGAIERWTALGFKNLNTYYIVNEVKLQNEGVRMEKTIVDAEKTVNDELIGDANFIEIKSELDLKNFFDNNVKVFGNPFTRKKIDDTIMELGLGATDDLVPSTQNFSPIVYPEVTSNDLSNLPVFQTVVKSKYEVRSPIVKKVQGTTLLEDIKNGMLPEILSSALRYTLFDIKDAELTLIESSQIQTHKNEADVDFFVDLIQYSYDNTYYADDENIYNDGEFQKKQEELFGKSELGNMIRDSFRSNFEQNKNFLDNYFNLNNFKQENVQDSDKKQMEFFEQVMEKIKSPPNEQKKYPFITRESAQMDRTFEYIKSQFAEYRQKFPAAL